MRKNETQGCIALRKWSINRKRRVLFTGVLILLNLLVCAGLYFSTILWRSVKYSVNHHRWIGSPYSWNAQYGYFPQPYTLAYHSLRYAERIPVLFDENGFRIPYREEQPEALAEFRILFLGDSFTHGYGVPAEKTFAYLTAQELHASAMNAGGSGWDCRKWLCARKILSRD
jgi:hypothetical protein